MFSISVLIVIIWSLARHMQNEKIPFLMILILADLIILAFLLNGAYMNVKCIKFQKNVAISE